jgi:mono/diheme cytochrome c family protein
MSCHIAADDPRFTTAQQPLKTHPYSVALGDVQKNGHWERKHKFTDYGCTICHQGQGRGLTQADAHGEGEFWPEPLIGYTKQGNWKPEFAAKVLGKDYMQAACAQCHTEQNFAGTALVQRGRELFFKTGCYGCHHIDGVSTGTLGPELTEVGKIRKLDYLWGHTVDPRAYSPTSFMPQFKLADDDKKALVIFLKSRRGTNYAENSLAHLMPVSAPATATAAGTADAPEVAADTSAARGDKLIHERACLACHKLDNQDGGISPDLSYEGLIRDEAFLMDHFNSPRSRVPDSVMPALGLPQPEFKAITTYLLTRTTPPPAMSPAETYKALCSRCHGEKGDGKGPSHIYIDPAPRDFTRTEFMVARPESRFIASIHDGVPGTSMPDWGKALTNEQINAVFDYVWQSYVKEPHKQLKPRNVPEQNPVPMSAESATRGEHIFLQRCTGCHGRKADGKGPNSLDITPRPRNLRNAAFIQHASDRRLMESVSYGVEGTAMPSWIDYGLTPNDIGDLVNFIRGLNTGKK